MAEIASARCTSFTNGETFSVRSRNVYNCGLDKEGHGLNEQTTAQIPKPSSDQGLQSALKSMGLLRNLLHGFAALCTLMMPFAMADSYTSGFWDVVFTGVLPATAPLVVVVIGLDGMMSSIWKSDALQEDRLDEAQRYQLIIRTHQVIGTILALAWLAVFLPALL